MVGICFTQVVADVGLERPGSELLKKPLGLSTEPRKLFWGAAVRPGLIQVGTDTYESAAQSHWVPFLSNIILTVCNPSFLCQFL